MDERDSGGAGGEGNGAPLTLTHAHQRLYTHQAAAGHHGNLLRLRSHDLFVHALEGGEDGRLHPAPQHGYEALHDADCDLGGHGGRKELHVGELRVAHVLVHARGVLYEVVH